MPSPQTAREHDRHILSSIASGRRVTQRSLADDLGVALGLTNLLIRRLVAKGYVKVTGLGTRHVRYLMTADGLEALARATRSSMENTVRLYTESREQIRSSLDELSVRCEVDESGRKPVLFYGAGDIAEIAYVSLQRTDLTLIGVVDDKRTGRFFQWPISSPAALNESSLDGVPYSQVVVTSLKHAAKIQQRLAARSIPETRIFCL